ncbi:enoyl-CoA hydratase-related protein [Halioxenophilus sp. WMMB6]|uniref:enoyl-CoA hydratase-related protein n=1 Tax=Halioxenophilus sp. WMMB6 TaxID=3073815 RepID=UPI00295EAFD8|nr:enoyl-CoA hydratase-related protein [Halioxenophilus sp. WMMB6]
MAIQFETKDHIALITLDKAERRNAVDGKMTRELRSALNRFESDPKLRVAILSGNGPLFCAGMDLAAFASGEAQDILRGEGRFAGFVAAKRVKPVIAAVHGAALAGGLELMLACDLVIAAEGTIFGLPEVRRGIIAGAGGAFRLTKRLPAVIANQMLLTGEPIGSDIALAHGLVNSVVPKEQLMTTALDMAAKIAGNAPISVKVSRAIAKYSCDGDENDCWMMNDKFWPEIENSEDAKEGAMAFVEKRTPIWKGK